MTIDLKWALPAIVPVALVLIARLTWWVSGAEWTDVEARAAGRICSIVGAVVGGVLAMAMDRESLCWSLRIGKRED